ncbi:ATP-binding protein [Natrialbaceae archaeon AArc-T1-2]|uniref:ATP-binding protein n=1 Tax=Natrialbaceae archaeon AArc-T1-2 TaxID=3053904 RepID=UPI00255B269D|nr:ATP-binding protein [Natrialbaceae archaeon AArc-T1-2]WIV66065.1 ATP-binding protein [Natrialbaceae archaeon AArc-T1-2]
MTTPYANERAHLRDELRRLDLLLERYLSAWRTERGGASQGGGLYVSGEQVDQLLDVDVGTGASATESSEPTHRSRRTSSPGSTPNGRDECSVHSNALEAVTEGIEQRSHRTLVAGTELRLVTLTERFDLDRRTLDALLVALAPELDVKYEKIYAYLQDDLTRKRPTVGLVLGVIAGSAGGALEHRDLFRRSPLVTDDLVRLSGPDDSMLSRFVEIDDRVVAYLLGDDGIDTALDSFAECVDSGQLNRTFGRIGAAGREVGQSRTDPAAGECGVDGWPDNTDSDVPSAVARLPLPVSTRRELGTLIDHLNGGDPTIVHFHGPYGAGPRIAVPAICATLGSPVVTVDATRLPSDGIEETLDLLVREARFADGALYVYDLDNPNRESEEERPERPGTVETALRRLDGFGGHVFLSGREPLSSRLQTAIDGHEFATLEFDRPAYELRRALWEAVDLPDDVDPSDLAAKFQFTPGQIDDAMATARASVVDGDPTPADVYEGCRAQSRANLAELAGKIEPSYTLEDIVLPDDELVQLRDVVAMVEGRGRVYSDWGFEAAHRGGSGINVLFAGPSGTGKTMAAEIVASETGLDLYRVDLASIVSKYIGETESNLQQLFDEAAASNAILFFDEADALFGERTEVSDSTDRYANVEVNYLLQRMEAHDGVVMLATNFKENVDEAFRRRINASVEFPSPDREARERIWRSIFPVETPVGDLDWSFLSSFELAGGDINNAALRAAFKAADDGGVVGMEHVVAAVRRELEKSGQLVSADDFGEYREYL